MRGGGMETRGWFSHGGLPWFCIDHSQSGPKSMREREAVQVRILPPQPIKKEIVWLKMNRHLWNATTKNAPNTKMGFVTH